MRSSRTRGPARAAALLFAAVLITIGLPSVAHAVTASVVGVVSTAGGLALPGVSLATVDATGITTTSTTDEMGWYQLDGVFTGEVTLTASADGYEPQSATLLLTEGDILAQDFVLEPSLVTPTPTDPTPTDPSATELVAQLGSISAVLTFVGRPPATIDALLTGPDGIGTTTTLPAVDPLALGDLTPGDYTLTISALGYLPVTTLLSVAPGADSALDLLISLAPGTPVISGTAQVGRTLTVNPGYWAWDQLSYQWLRDGVAVDGATGAAYALTAADLGASMTVWVGAQHDGVVLAEATSTATPPVVAGILRPGQVWLKGKALVGQTVTVTTSGWPSDATLSYQWLRNGTVIAGVSDASYQLTPEDLRATVTVRVTGSAPGYRSVQRLAAAVKVINGVFDATRPSITGTLRTGETLTVNPGVWAPEATLSYQWYRDGTKISGATAATYELTRRDRGRSMRVVVTGTSPGYTPLSISSHATTRVR